MLAALLASDALGAFSCFFLYFVFLSCCSMNLSCLLAMFELQLRLLPSKIQNYCSTSPKFSVLGLSLKHHI